jgi:mono/diheme cytochrome c family protein
MALRRTTKAAIGALVIVIPAFFAAGWLILNHGFSARDEPTAVEAFFARRLRRMAVPRSKIDARNPVLASPEVLSEAMAHFADHCATCHANDGSGSTAIGKGLYPKPPDMRQSQTQDLTDGEIFYIIHNGIRLTGMPAFGEGGANEEADVDSWKLVHFIRHLPKITPEELEQMKEMNPRSPAELKEEEELERFLNGDDSTPPETEHKHHH